MNGAAQRLGHEAGQAVVFLVVTLTCLIGMAALVIDGGSWLRAQRHLQTAADAAALAGAQNLPTDQAGAQSVAISYAQQNYGGLAAPAVTFTVSTSSQRIFLNSPARRIIAPRTPPSLIKTLLPLPRGQKLSWCRLRIRSSSANAASFSASA